MSLLLLKIITVVSCVIFTYGDIQIPRNCLDEQCSEPISSAFTVMGYNGDRGDKLSFKPKQTVKVYGKPPQPQSDDDLWFVELNGKRGFIAKRFLKETKIFRRTNENLAAININKSPMSVDIPGGVRDSVKVISDFNKTITSQETTVEVVADPNVSNGINNTGEDEVPYPDAAESQEDEYDDVSIEDDTGDLNDEDIDAVLQSDNVVVSEGEISQETLSNEQQHSKNGDKIDNIYETQVSKADKLNSNKAVNDDSTKQGNFNIDAVNHTPNSDDNPLAENVPSIDNVKEEKLIANGAAHTSISSNGITTENTFHINSQNDGDVNVSDGKHTSNNDVGTSIESTSNINHVKEEKLNLNEVNHLSNSHIGTPTENGSSINSVNDGEINVSGIKHISNKDYGTPTENGYIFDNVKDGDLNVNDAKHLSNSHIETLTEDESNVKSVKDGDVNFSDEKHISNSDKGTPVEYTTNTNDDLKDNVPNLNVQIPNIQPKKVEAVFEGTTIYSDVFNSPEKILFNENVQTINTPTNNQPVSQNIPGDIPLMKENKIPVQNNLQDLNADPRDEIRFDTATFSESVIEKQNEIANLGKSDEVPDNFHQNDSYNQASLESNTLPLSIHDTAADNVPRKLPEPTQPNIYNPYPLPKILHPDSQISEKAVNDDVNSNDNLFEKNSYIIRNEAVHMEEEANTKNMMSKNNDEPVSIIDTFLTIFPLDNFTSLWVWTSIFSGDLYSAIGIDFFENQPGLGMSTRMVMFLFIVSVTILTFTLGYYFLDIKRQDGKLVGMVNTLQKDLLCYTKECDMLKDELTITKEKLSGIEDSSFGTDEMVISLKQDINKRDIKIQDLENELEKTVKELQSTTRAAEQLQSFIDEVLQWKDQTKLEEDMANIEQLQEENDKLVNELKAMQTTEERNATELLSITKLYDDASNVLKVQLHEIESLKEALNDLHGNNISTEELSSIIDHSELRAQLKAALQDKEFIEEQLRNDKSSHGVLESELKATMESLRKSEQATTKLEVLCDHFKKREADLVKELSAKESLWLSTQGETMTIEKMQTLQTEVEQYKDMCEELRRELADVEAAHRSVKAELEKREHTAWLEARKAQREAEAHRLEAAALRRKLAAPNTAVPAAALSPSLPLLPPPLPPPLLPPPHPLARPPPLGRHPSPPFSPSSTVLANSPPPRYSDYISDRDYPDRRGRSPYSPTRRSHQRRRSYSNDRYYDDDRRHNHMTETETDYSPPPSPRHRRSSRSPRRGPSSGSGQSSDSDK